MYNIDDEVIHRDSAGVITYTGRVTSKHNIAGRVYLTVAVDKAYQEAIDKHHATDLADHFTKN